MPRSHKNHNITERWVSNLEMKQTGIQCFSSFSLHLSTKYTLKFQPVAERYNILSLNFVKCTEYTADPPRSRVCPACSRNNCYGNICASLRSSFAVAPAQTRGVIHNSPHLPACLSSYVDIVPHRVYFDCTFRSFYI
jgi:hypothetical protein